MKRIYFVTTLILLSLCALGQVKMPSAIILPAKAWCLQNGYCTEVVRTGDTIRVADYEKALKENKELATALSTTEALLAERGLPVKRLQQTLESIRQDSAGMSASVIPYGNIINNAKPDLEIRIDWSAKKAGFRTEVDFTIRAAEISSKKMIAKAMGTSSAFPAGPDLHAATASMAERALIQAINEQMDPFCFQLENYLRSQLSK